MRMGARLDGMTNGSELLINIVMYARAKGADRLEPKGMRSVNPLYDWDYADTTTAGGKAVSKPSLSFKWNRVSPYLRPSGQVNRKERC